MYKGLSLQGNIIISAEGLNDHQAIPGELYDLLLI